MKIAAYAQTAILNKFLVPAKSTRKEFQLKTVGSN